MSVNYIQRILDRFNNSLESMGKANTRLQRSLENLFDALSKRGIVLNAKANDFSREMRDSERRIREASENVLWLLNQSLELPRVTSLISSSLSLSDVLDEVMDTVITMTSADRAYIVLRDRDSGEMSIAAARNWERESLSEDDVVFSRHVVDLVLESGEAITTANAAEDTRFEKAESVYAYNLRSILCVPLQLRDALIGVLYADNPIQRGIFRPDGLPIMEAFAQQTAIAIENAQLYERLEQYTMQLQEANRLKSEFLGIISHELKTPFANIGYAMQLFPRYGMEALDPEQRKIWDELAQGISTADKLVSGLVTYAGLLSKQGALQRERIDVRTLFEDILFDAERLARRHHITIELHTGNHPLMASVDAERLSEAIWHLVQNAIQYNREGGSVKIGATIAQQNLLIQVSDTGLGIPPEDQERIWLAFEQMSDAVRRGVEGLGIGLPLVRYVAQAHGGSVSLKSIPGKGSAFTIKIPAQR